MFCPSCYLPNTDSPYVCCQCKTHMCDSCATFALHCGSTVCLDCEIHECVEESCHTKLLINMTVDQLLKTFCNEDMSTTKWERMGNEYSQDDVKITETESTRLPFTNIFSFPQILQCRVYNVLDYTKAASWIWRQIRLANNPAQDFQQYIERVHQLSDYDFICWYKHRYTSTYSTFEDRVFQKSSRNIKQLFLMYYEQSGELELFIEKLKEELLLKNEKFSIREEDKIPK